VWGAQLTNDVGMMLRRFVARLATVAVVVALLMACTSSYVHRLRVDSADADLIGRWRDATGQELPDGTNAMGGVLVVSTGAGSTSCTEDHVTVFMQLAWPVGTELDLNSDVAESDAPMFVRDTAESLLETEGTSDFDAELPKTAKPTGFNREGNAISVVPDGHAVYVTRASGRIERWPRLKPGQGCPS
jgi:hypothetical protein